VPSDKCCTITSHCIGQRGLGPPFQGVRGSREGCSILVLTVRVPCGLDLSWRTLPLSSELIRCQSNHDVYVCSHGGVSMSSGDRMDISSQVPVARRTWEPVVMYCLVWH
jgi:hypothetical protein